MSALARDQHAINRLIEAARVETRKAATPVGPPPIQWFNFLSLMGDVESYLARQSRDAWRQAFVPIVQGVIGDQASNWATVLGVQFDVRNLYAERWFEAYILEFAQAVSQTTGDGISTVLQQSVREGWGFDQTTGRLQQVFRQWQAGGQAPADFDWLEARMPTYRAMTIARTETMRASNAGALRLFEEWGADGKEWAAHLDHRVRDSHRAADGQVQPAGQPFTVGGARLMYPLDSSLGAPLGEIINCRCTVLPVIADAAGPAAQPLQPSPALQAPPTPDEMAQQAMERVLRADQAIKDEDRRLEREYHRLRDAYSTASKAYRWVPADERAQARVDLDRLSADLDRAADALFSDRRTQELRRQAAMKNALAAPNGPGMMDPTVMSEATGRRARVSNAQKTDLTKVIDFLTAVIGKGTGFDDVQGRFNVWNHTKNRAYANSGQIFVRSTEAAETIAHEIGHVIEYYDRRILADNIAWRDGRTQGDIQTPMNRLPGHSGYGPMELTKPDRFIHPYIGKYYGDWASEVLSMGLEYLYRDAADLARRDPDMFLQIMRVLRQYGGQP